MHSIDEEFIRVFELPNNTKYLQLFSRHEKKQLVDMKILQLGAFHLALTGSEFEDKTLFVDFVEKHFSEFFTTDDYTAHSFWPTEKKNSLLQTIYNVQKQVEFIGSRQI